MENLFKTLQVRLRISRRLLFVYLLIFGIAGFTMNNVGILLGIAKFANWWQIFTCYWLYMIPIALLLRDRPAYEQYAWGVVAMGPLELAGYALGTSQALGIAATNRAILIEGNLLAEILDIKNFSLAMTLFFGVYFPILNSIVKTVYEKLFYASSIGIAAHPPGNASKT